MKKCLLVLLLFICAKAINAQTITLKTNGHTNTFYKIDSLVLEEFDGTAASATDKSIAEDRNVTKNSKGRLRIISPVATRSNADKYRFLLKTTTAAFKTNFYKYTDGTLQAPTSTLFFRPSQAINVQEIAGKYGIVEAHPVFKGYYYLQVTNPAYASGEKIFELCNTLYLQKKVTMVEPDFVRLIPLQNPLRPIQWNIRNTGNPAVTGAVAGADMHVENAWCFATGQGINVAVIDNGVELTHPDLQANLLPGFDATGNNSGGGPNANDAHGTNCAGIIGSIDNLIGAIGVAYNARVIPIRMGFDNATHTGTITSDAQISNSFTAAVNSGASVISNSWGAGAVSTQIDLAIQNAVNNGRGGLGCVVLFAAGNSNGPIAYPASNANVIAVGASAPCDTRKRSSSNPGAVNPGVSTDPAGVSCDGETWWGSNFGTGLDLIAPGVLIPTTDLAGLNGFDTDDYNEDFNGTSAACPNTAAVCALILSANPNLTGAQVRGILERNCDKIGGYTYATTTNQFNGTWTAQAGYGRVNAEKAVREAIATGITMSGPASVCTQGTYTLSGVPAGLTVTWSVTPASGVVSISSTTGNSTTVTKVGNGSYTLRATITNACSPTPITIQRRLFAGPSTPDIQGPYDPVQHTVMGVTCQNKQYYFVAIDPVMPDPNATYVWTRLPPPGSNDFPTLYGGSTVYMTFPELGQYTLRLQKTTSCGTITIERNYNVQECFSSFRITASPNPARSTALVTVDNESGDVKQLSKTETVRMELYELNTSTRKKQWSFKNNQQQYSLGLQGLPKGIYILNVTKGKFQQSTKIIIE